MDSCLELRNLVTGKPVHYKDVVLLADNMVKNYVISITEFAILVMWFLWIKSFSILFKYGNRFLFKYNNSHYEYKAMARSSYLYDRNIETESLYQMALAFIGIIIIQCQSITFICVGVKMYMQYCYFNSLADTLI